MEVRCFAASSAACKGRGGVGEGGGDMVGEGEGWLVTYLVGLPGPALCGAQDMQGITQGLDKLLRALWRGPEQRHLRTPPHTKHPTQPAQSETSLGAKAVMEDKVTAQTF